jgi:hypothetical protein
MIESLTTAAAVSAANIQISTNAIAKLASDIGDICSMLNATDYQSDLFFAIQEIEPRISAVAYDSELLSQAAMEISVMAAESEDISKKSKALLDDTKTVSEKLKEVVYQVTKFEILIESTKARNPLIPYDLITIVHTAASDGINAKLLIEIALRSINTLVAVCQNN